MKVYYLLGIILLLGLSTKSQLPHNKSVALLKKNSFATFDGVSRQEESRYHGPSYATEINSVVVEERALDLIDVGATGLLYPVAESCHDLFPEQIFINVFNYGVNDINFATKPLTIVVQVTGAVVQSRTTTINNGVLSSGATGYYPVGTSLDMTTPGAYYFNAYTILTSDANVSNNAMPQAIRIIRPFADLPDSIHFNNYDGTNLANLFPEWYEANGAIAPTDSTSLWKSQTGLGSLGNISARVNLHGSGHNEWIVGPKFWATQDG